MKLNIKHSLVIVIVSKVQVVHVWEAFHFFLWYELSCQFAVVIRSQKTQNSCELQSVVLNVKHSNFF